jgi:protocatechuate 3,4-dioxygenase beta subunit
LALLGGGGLLALAACGSDDDAAPSTDGTDEAPGTTTGQSASTSSSDTTVASDTGESIACETIPSETGGPFPGDGSNGPDVLSENGVVRRDITSSIGSASGVADGVPLAITLDLVDTANGCSAFAGAAVYIWHCDREGRYSMYSEGVTDQNYLRGVQEADANGQVTFQSIFPAAYSGRWPHIHFEVYPSLDAATAARGILAMSQIALPEETCNLVYATEGYEQSVRNMAQTSLTTDNVFSDDGGVRQIPTTSGDVASGFSVKLTVPV